MEVTPDQRQYILDLFQLTGLRVVSDAEGCVLEGTGSLRFDTFIELVTHLSRPVHEIATIAIRVAGNEISFHITDHEHQLHQETTDIEAVVGYLQHLYAHYARSTGSC